MADGNGAEEIAANQSLRAEKNKNKKESLLDDETDVPIAEKPGNKFDRMRARKNQDVLDPSRVKLRAVPEDDDDSLLVPAAKPRHLDIQIDDVPLINTSSKRQQAKLRTVSAVKVKIKRVAAGGHFGWDLISIPQAL